MNLWKGLLKQIAGRRESFAEGRKRKGCRIARTIASASLAEAEASRTKEWRIFDSDRPRGTSSACFGRSIRRAVICFSAQLGSFASREFNERAITLLGGPATPDNENCWRELYIFRANER